MKKCFVENCENKIAGNYDGNQYCGKHLYQLKRHGKILIRTRFDPNEIVFYDEYAEIILYDKDGNEREKTQIDLEDVEKCRNTSWHLKTWKTRRYVNGKFDGKNFPLHRYLLDCKNSKKEVDHIDGNGLNNRKNNLRLVTHQQNMMNQRVLPSNNTTGYIGIWFNKQLCKYSAQIKFNKKNIHLGQYDDLEDAIEARKQGELKYFGENKIANYENQNKIS